MLDAIGAAVAEVVEVEKGGLVAILVGPPQHDVADLECGLFDHDAVGGNVEYEDVVRRLRGARAQAGESRRGDHRPQDRRPAKTPHAFTDHV